METIRRTRVLAGLGFLFIVICYWFDFLPSLSGSGSKIKVFKDDSWTRSDEVGTTYLSRLLNYWRLLNIAGGYDTYLLRSPRLIRNSFEV